MSRPARLRPEAEADVRDAYLWYEERARGLGDEFLRAIDAALASVERRPEAYPVVHERVHRVLLRKFPYGLFYVVEPNAVVILACFHARRNPKRWQDRA